MTVDFKQRIKSVRQWSSPAQDGSDDVSPLEAFESDRGRIINSAAVRRLQQKTQVFPLERNAAVRSRLTHSMEVQQVGRYISQTIVKKLAEKNLLEATGLAGLERQFETVVDMACLMHDIGNPPFGHFGEAAINQWMARNIDDFFQQHAFDQTSEHSRLRALFSLRHASANSAGLEAVKRDLCNFEGNAQGLRIIDTLQNLNLTYSQISGLLKYPRRGDQKKPQGQYLAKKVGFYLSENSLLKRLQQALAMEAGTRSPFAYVMEAADDISYCIADIEDAVEKGILRIDDVPELLNREYSALFRGEKSLGKAVIATAEQSEWMSDITRRAYASYQKSGLTGNFFVSLRVGINSKAVEHAAERFVENLEAVFSGGFDEALTEDGSACHLLLQTLKNVALERVFSHQEVEAQELQGYRIITGLLDLYRPLLELPRDSFADLLAGKEKTHLYASRLFKKLPGKHLNAYKQALDNIAVFSADLKDKKLASLSEDLWEWYFRTRLLLDYISGMTDQFAYDEYRVLSVIERPA